MDIHKISVGGDYKNGAMHYILGQEVLNGNYKIHLIHYEELDGSFKIWIENNKHEVQLWKTFLKGMPIAIEHNLIQ